MSISRAAPTTDHASDETAPHDARLFTGEESGTSAPDASRAWPERDDDSEDGVARDAPELRHDRFKISDKLGEGGMGVVYRALDTHNGREVALKLMKGSLAGTARRRFEREFRSLSALHHPHCLSVFDYGELDRGPFFTMELFKGRPITSLAGRGVEEVLDPLFQVTLALDHIHHHGLVHRDVKPSNILVRPATRRDGLPGFEAKLLDFGLAKYYGVKSSLSAEAGFVGTVAYCAPEQLNNDELDHRVDLYCLGLVSYELLSGRYPFPEARLAGMRSLMRAQLNDKPRPLADVSPEIPKPIADAVMKYLRKEPRRRPDSAALLRHAIAEHLGIDDQTAVYTTAVIPARPVLSNIGFVCRSHELDALDDMLRRCLSASEFDDSMAGNEAPASLIVVSGEPGIGKSSVVQEAERIARGHGCQVYEGRCFDGNLSPFQPFVEIIRQLIAELRLQERREAARPDLDLTGTHVAGLPAESSARLLGIVNDYRGELLRIAPELRKYLPGDAYSQADPGSDPDYIFRALSAFFVEIATLQPVCLSFEDLQWADKSSLDLLRHLAASLVDARRATADGSIAAPRLVIVASARSGYAQLDALMAPLRERQHVMELRLSPLAEGETRELIALRLNCRPEELSDDLVVRVHDLCGGNPFFVSETVREWLEKDAIARSDGVWTLSTQAADASDLPQTVRDAMRLRLEGLPAKTQQVLGAAAVIGAVVDIDLLRDVLPDLTETDVLDAIDALLPRRVLRETGNAGRVEFVHDLLRELSYGDLSATRRRSLHRRVGELLERRREQGQSVAAAVLADHFRNAEDRSKAFTYAMEAAEAALNAYAFNNAITHLNDALKLLPDQSDDAIHYHVWDMLGTAHGSAGQLDEAIAAYQQALGHATDRITRATACYGIGAACQRKGLFDDAIRNYDIALREVGFPRPLSVPGRFFDLWRTSVFFHMLPSGLHAPFGGPDRDRRIEIAFAAYYRHCWLSGSISMLTYTQCCYKIAALAKQSKKPEHVAIAYSKFGLNLSVFSLDWFAMVYSRIAVKAAESCRRDEVQAMARAHLGTTHYCGGRLDEAEKHLREAVGILDKIRDSIGMFSHHFLRHIYAVRGDIPAELTQADAEIAIATASGDAETLAWGQYGKADAFARAGRIDEAQDLATRSVDALIARNSMTLAIAREILGFVRLQASDYTGARTALEQSRSSINRNFYLNELVGPTYPLLVESLLGPRWDDAEDGPSRAVARKAWRESRFARLIGWRFPNYHPHALRVSGRAAYALGKPKKAAQYLTRSIAAAEALGARYDLARALLDASRVIPDRADDYRRRGQQLLDELGAVVPEAERLSS
jgi:serine/threonine protein kinase/tetratricopeptide (TPR) repeat protein